MKKKNTPFFFWSNPLKDKGGYAAEITNALTTAINSNTSDLSHRFMSLVTSCKDFRIKRTKQSSFLKEKKEKGKS